MRADRAEYVEKITRWLVDWRGTPKEISEAARRSTGLDGVYRGKSPRIHRLVWLAYLRGVRRGASMAWEARQSVGPRRLAGEPE